jgi:hypothetical protein
MSVHFFSRKNGLTLNYPLVLLRPFDRPGTDWVEMHMPAQCPSVPFLLDQNGFETTLEQRPGAPMPSVRHRRVACIQIMYATCEIRLQC